MSAVLGGVILTMIEGAGLLFTRAMGSMADPLSQMNTAPQSQQQTAPMDQSGLMPMMGGGTSMSGIESGMESQQPATAGIPNFV